MEHISKRDTNISFSYSTMVLGGYFFYQFVDIVSNCESRGNFKPKHWHDEGNLMVRTTSMKGYRRSKNELT